jgi:hypothetical protein
MKRIFSGMLNPYLLSLWVTLIILFIFPVNIEKYKVNLVEHGEYVQHYKVH